MKNSIKKILITSSDAMMYQFLLKHALNLIEQGYHVDLACIEAEDYEGQDYFNRIRRILPGEYNLFHLDSKRFPLSPNNIKGLKQLKNIISKGNYDLIWTNEPVMGVLTRIAARKHRKKGLRVMYVAHGFHFYKGAPLKNWLVFYPIEKLFSRITDKIVTINTDDYKTAQQRLSCKSVEYIRGIGFDTQRFADTAIDRKRKRQELGIPENAFLLMSAGELNNNKNHRVVIEALAELEADDIYYIICGEGPRHEDLQNLIEEKNLQERVFLLGFREDIPEICKASDVYCFPSVREGLSVSMLEAMSCALPCVCSNIRGNRDLIKENKGGFLCNPFEADQFKTAIEKLYFNQVLLAEFGNENIKTVELYNSNSSKKSISEIIEKI